MSISFFRVAESMPGAPSSFGAFEIADIWPYRRLMDYPKSAPGICRLKALYLGTSTTRLSFPIGFSPRTMSSGPYRYRGHDSSEGEIDMIRALEAVSTADAITESPPTPQLTHFLSARVAPLYGCMVCRRVRRPSTVRACSVPPSGGLP